MAEKYTEAQKRASMKYQSKTVSMQIRLTEEERENFRKACEFAGENQTVVIKRLIAEYIKKGDSFKKVKTLKDIKEDRRVYSIDTVSGEDFGEDGIMYEISLEDGFVFADGSSLDYVKTVKEACILINEIERGEA